jgi:hypothetical protein
VVEFILVVLLVLFVCWGARTSPNRSFSWGMYSGSTKGFLWTEAAGVPRVLNYDEVRLAPDSHFMSVPELRRLMDQGNQKISLNGLIIGSSGNWLIHYDGDVKHHVEKSLPVGLELDQLVTLLRRLPPHQ